MTADCSARNAFRKGGVGGHITNSGRNIITTANPSGGINATLLQKQMSFKSSIGASSLFSKTDEVEIIDCSNIDSLAGQYNKNNLVGWICCAPCTWLRTSATVHKMAITTATLLVTTLLVASPILFLISTAPSPLPKDCYNDGEGCIPTVVPSSECSEPICKMITDSIQAKLNWNKDPCKEFKQFCCADPAQSNANVIFNAQQAVDLQIKNLLQHNTTSGMFEKLGVLFKSCLKQNINSSSIYQQLNNLGGYIPIGSLGPVSINGLISKMYQIGPSPLVDIYYDLSYGKRPHILLIISGPGASITIIENKIRWMGPKAPLSRVKPGVPILFDEVIENFLPNELSYAEKASEKDTILTFIKDLNKIQVEHSRRGFWDSSVFYNTSMLQEMFPVLNWTMLIPNDWTGPIVVRNSEYLRALEEHVFKYPTRVTHNALLLLFALGILPQGYPSPMTCTRATMWALPDVSSALYVKYHSTNDLKNMTKRADAIFKSLKAHLKRAPSLKGAALVKLSALKIQTQPWKDFTNLTAVTNMMKSLQIRSDNWFENILHIYKRNQIVPNDITLSSSTHDAWAYPILSNVFYDTLSHSIVVPLSVISTPYFDGRLPPYLHYASVGVSISKEILRSITKNFDEKAMRCVPQSVNIFSNFSRMDLLIHSGGMQISYHSMISTTGSIKTMPRLPGINLTSKQIFFLISAQELCTESDYVGIDTSATEFSNILGWLIAQGGSATEVFKCPTGSMINAQKTCNVL